MLKLRIGSRTSKLAISQVAEVHLLLADHFSNLQIEIIPITTSGDKIQDRNLAELGGKGLFIKELEEALLQNRIDIAVHSAKDVPPIIHAETEIAAFTPRLDARDCLVSKNFDSLKNLPKGAVIGTSSPRRKAILLRLRPDLKIVNFRGNVDTRLTKVDEEEVAGSILALCGLERLGKEHKIKKIIEKDVILPAGGQGSLAIQIKKSDKKIYELLQKINHLDTEICVKAERSFLHELGASCITPIAVHAEIENEKLNLRTLILDYDGSEVFETNSSGKAEIEEAIKLAIEAAKKTRKEAEKLLSKISGFDKTL
jgi:hydroxymethylbilane synthase